MNKLNTTHFVVFFIVLLTFFVELSGGLNLPGFDLEYQNFTENKFVSKKINLDKPIKIRKRVSENLTLNFKPNGYSTLVNIIRT